MSRDDAPDAKFSAENSLRISRRRNGWRHRYERAPRRREVWREHEEASASLALIQRLAESLAVEPLALLTAASAAPSIAPIAAEPTRKKAKRVTRKPAPEAPVRRARVVSKRRRRA